MVCGPKGQEFTQPEPFGPGIDPTKIVMRPEGPVVHFDESKDQRNVRPFRPQIMCFTSFPRAERPWLDELPTHLGRKTVAPNSSAHRDGLAMGGPRFVENGRPAVGLFGGVGRPAPNNASILEQGTLTSSDLDVAADVVHQPGIEISQHLVCRAVLDTLIDASADLHSNGVQQSTRGNNVAQRGC